MPLPDLPLPKGINNQARSAPKVGGSQNKANAGLVFNKFINCWGYSAPDQNGNRKFGLFDNGEQAKLKWIKCFAGKPIGNSEELEKVTSRQFALAKKTLADKNINDNNDNDLLPRNMISDSRFVIGMGYEHALENGFFWHHTLGVPYLPASSIKGMMRAFADHWQALGDGDDPNSEDWFNRIVELFGNYGPPQKDDPDTARGVKPKHREARMGRLIVFDALPIKPVQLVAEILTNHDGGWRAKGAEIMKDGNGHNIPGNPLLSPGDWHNPNPVPFLAVEHGVEHGNEFQFALGLARGGTKEDLKEGYILLEAALRWIGIGAKTATGFGRFVDASQAKKEFEAEQEEWRKNLKAGNEVMFFNNRMKIASINPETGKAKLINLKTNVQQKKAQPFDKLTMPKTT